MYLWGMAYDIKNTFKQILLSIEEGNSLRTTLKREGMPTSTTFYDWIDNDKEKALHYARACEERADVIFEEIFDIADNTDNDTIFTDKGEIPNSEWIARSRLRVDARKWALSKMNPKKYGDKVESINTNINIDAGKLTDEEIKKINDNLEQSY